MNKLTLRTISTLLIFGYMTSTLADSDRFLGPRDRRGLKAAIEGYIKHNDSIFQYGNWYGPGWWGGSKGGNKPGNKLPVDSLDAIAQKHDFCYQIAEQQGKIYGIAEEKRLKAIADYIAVRDAKALPENPKDWQLPPSDVNKAARYRDRMITGFSYEAPAYEGVSVVGKGLDWATSPIENWELDKSHQLTAADLEKHVSILQKDWNTKHFPPLVKLELPLNISKKGDKTDTTTTEKPNKPQSAPEQAETNTNTDTSDNSNTKKSTDNTTTDTKPAAKSSQPTPEIEQADKQDIENDPDYIELMRLSNEMMSLANSAMAQAKAGKIPSNSTVNKITALQNRISALSKRIETKYAKKRQQTSNEDKNQTPEKTSDNRGGTVYNKDGSKEVLHYEKDPDGKEVAVWTTYDKNGRVINRRRDK